jgi:uncharacterized protein YvpB
MATPQQFRGFVANVKNWDPVKAMNAKGITNVLQDQGARVRNLSGANLSDVGREIDRGTKVAVRLQVPNQNMGHLVRVEGVTPDGKWVRYADPWTGQSYRVSAGDFEKYLDRNQIFAAKWP